MNPGVRPDYQAVSRLPNLRYRREIDGLRALAVVSVILYHAGFKAFSGGFVGVDVFFVISGYLITAILISELEAGYFSIAHFYERRARRILPALFLVMFVCLPFAWVWLLPREMMRFSQSLVAVSVFSSNVFFWKTTSYFETATELKPFIHTWSLSAEEQFYVLYPLFLYFAWKLGKRGTFWVLAAVALFSFALVQWSAYAKPTFSFYMLPTRAWELLIGTFVALYASERDISHHKYWTAELGSLLGLALVGTAIFVYSDQTPTPSLFTLAPTIGAALIIVFTTNKTYVGKLLSSKPFVGVGLISYSAYLWHQPLFAFARNRDWKEPGLDLISVLAMGSIALAYLSWRFVERPFRNRNTLSKWQVLDWSVLVSLGFIAFGLAGNSTDGFANRKGMEKFQALEFTNEKLGYADCKEDFRQEHGVEIDYCYLPKTDTTNAVIIGDSHANDKYYGIRRSDQSHHWGLLGHNGCPPVLGISVEGNTLRNCLDKSNAIFNSVLNNDEIKTVALSFYGQYFLDTAYAAGHVRGKVGPPTVTISSQQETTLSREELFYKGLEASVAALLQANKKVYLLIDVPELPYFPSDCLKGRPDCQIPLSEVLERQKLHRQMILRLAKEYPALRVFDPISMYCNHKECSYKDDDIIIYRDSHHLTFEGSDLYGETFADWILKGQAAQSAP